jgi:hypothetical protein
MRSISVCAVISPEGLAGNSRLVSRLRLGFCSILEISRRNTVPYRTSETLSGHWIKVPQRAVIGASVPHIGDIVGGLLCLTITST